MNRRIGYDRATPLKKGIVNNVIDRFVLLPNDVHQIDGHDSLEIPPFACEFHPNGKHFVVADEDGIITIINPKEPKIICEQWRAHENAVFDISWSHDGIAMLTASGDQTCISWDVQYQKVIRAFPGHSGSVKTVTYSIFDSHIFASGARDGSVMLWDHRNPYNNGCVAKIASAHFSKDRMKSTPVRKKKKQENHVSSVTCVLFQSENSLVSCGSDDGEIKVWDTRRSYATSSQFPIPAYSMKYCGTSKKRPGYSHLLFDKGRSTLYANCIDNVIYKYNLASYNEKPITSFNGHENKSFFIKSCLSPDDEYLISGSSNHNAYIWKTSLPGKPMWELDYHAAEVTAVAWNHTDLTNVVTCADDFTIGVWHPSIESTDQQLVCGRIKRIQSERVEQNVSSKPATSIQTHSCDEMLNMNDFNNSPSPRVKRFMKNYGLDFSPTVSLSRKELMKFKSLNAIQTYHAFGFHDSDSENSSIDSYSSSKSCTSTPKSVLSPSKSMNIQNLKSESVRRSLELDKADVGNDSLKNQSPGPSFSSPTSSLPNYVVDGFPRSSTYPVKKKKQSKVDWLSSLGKHCKRRKLIVHSEPKCHEQKLTKASKTPSSSPVLKSKLIPNYFKKL